MDWDYTRLITVCIVTCVVYVVVMTIFIAANKYFWIQEYPKAVREKYFELNPQKPKPEKGMCFLRLYLKKIIALLIYIIVMFAVAQTAEDSAIFITESFVACIIIWPVIMLFEMLVLDIVLIGHVKKLRLPGTENMNAEYRRIGKKTLLNGAAGLIFGLEVFFVLYVITMAVLMLDLWQLKVEVKQQEKEIKALLREEHISTEDLNLYKNLDGWLTAHEDDFKTPVEESLDELFKETDGQEFADAVIDDIPENNEAAVTETDEDNAMQADAQTGEVEDVNRYREIVRERPVLTGDTLWSLAEDIFGNPYKWCEIYELNKEIIGENQSLIYKGQYLQIPYQEKRYCEDGLMDYYSNYEYCYEDITAELYDWEGITEYIAPDCSYEIQNCIFYYGYPEGNGEEFKICYPKLVSHNGTDVSVVNAGIRDCAMKYADKLLLNRTGEFAKALQMDENMDESLTQSSVNYIITYLNDDLISVVFQDHIFEGSIYAENLELRTYVADIDTGIILGNEELISTENSLELAELIHQDMLAQSEGSEMAQRVFDEVLTPELMSEALRTNEAVDNRYFIDAFLTDGGMGFAFSYRVNETIDGSQITMRGWRNTILPVTQMTDYLGWAVEWEENTGE